MNPAPSGGLYLFIIPYGVTLGYGSLVYGRRENGCRLGTKAVMSDTKPVRPDRVGAATPILDVRRHKGRRQIRGAVQYHPNQLLDADSLTLPLPRDGPIVVYGDDDSEVDEVVERLHENGFSGAARLEGGMLAWQSAGLALEDLTQEQPIPDEPSSGLRRL